ncbi:MAG: guanylate kinase [bacterium]
MAENIDNKNSNLNDGVIYINNINNNLYKDDLPKGIIFVISAPSGTGKTTLCKMLSGEFKDLKVSVSFTTRAMRHGETEGKSYNFVNDEVFENMIANNEFIEWANVFGNKYGTPVKSVFHKPSYDTLLEIDVQGAEKLRKYYDEIHKLYSLVTIFIKPPSEEALIERLKKRGEIKEEELKRRLDAANYEIEKSRFYNYTITNDVLGKAYLKLKSIVIAERCKNAFL